MMVPTKRRSSAASSESVTPPKKSKLSTSRNLSSSSSSRKRKKSHPVPHASPKKPKLSTPSPTTTPDWLPDGWIITVLSKPSGYKYKVYKETETGKKFYSKPQVLNYLTAIPFNADATNSISNNTKVNKVTPPEKNHDVSTISTEPPSETPKLYRILTYDEMIRIRKDTLPPRYLLPNKPAPPPKKPTTSFKRKELQPHLPSSWRKFLKTSSSSSSSSSSWEETSSSSWEETSSSSSTREPVKVAPPEKTQVSTLSSAPSEVPKELYDVIQKVASARKSLKRNNNNRFAKLKLEHYKPEMRNLVREMIAMGELPCCWKYDPKASYVSEPPPSPPKPKPKPKPKTKKEIKITCSSPNYHGRYPLNNDEQNVWNQFTINERTEANEFEYAPIDNLVTVEDAMVVDLVGKFAVDIFNKSCHLYLNRDEDNMVSGAEFIECKFFKLTDKYIFYLTIEAIERGIRGVYTTKVACETKNGARTLLNFRLTNRKSKGNVVEPQVESKGEYETVQDGSSDPQDFYKLTGMAHRHMQTKSGGFNYYNPKYSAHLILRCQKVGSFSANVSGLSEFLAATKTS